MTVVELVETPLVRLCEVAQIITGSTPPTTNQSNYGDDVPFVTPADLGSPSAVVTTARSLSTFGAAASRIVPAGSVLVCCIGSLGKIGIAGTDVATNQQINSVVFDPELVFPKYGFFACSQLTPQMTKFSSSTTVPIISKSKFANLSIPLPPLPEQRRIASILDKADRLRTQRREALAHLDALTQSIFHSMFGNPVSNSSNWPTAKLSTLGKLDRGVSKHRPRNDPRLLNGTHPLIQTGDVANSGGYITKFKSTYSDLGLSQSKIWPIGTLCITIAANIAKTGILKFKACFPDSVVGFTANESTVVFVQVWMGFLQKILENNAPESAQKNINLAILRDLDVINPPMELQQTFARRVAAVERLKEKHRAHLAELDTLFASLQHRAFKGEL